MFKRSSIEAIETNSNIALMFNRLKEVSDDQKALLEQIHGFQATFYKSLGELRSDVRLISESVSSLKRLGERVGSLEKNFERAESDITNIKNYQKKIENNLNKQTKTLEEILPIFEEIKKKEESREELNRFFWDGVLGNLGGYLASIIVTLIVGLILLALKYPKIFHLESLLELSPKQQQEQQK